MYNVRVRILFVSPFYKPYLGGVERVIENLSAEFIKQRHEVTVLTTKYSFPRTYHADWSAEEIIDGVRVFRLESYPHKALPFYQAPLTWFSPLQVRQIVKTCSPDVIIYMTDKWFGGNFLVRLFADSIKGVRHIWCPVFHDLTPAKFWLRPINWLFGNLINDVAVVSKIEAEKVKRTYGVLASKIKIIPWGVTVPTVEPPHGAALPVVNILCVGRISHHKGQIWLLERFIEVCQRTPVNCRLLLVGEVEEPEVYEELKTKTCHPGRRDPGSRNVIIDTRANDEKLREYYQQADVFALFPEYESFGLVFLEAMSFGVPVLTHNVGAIKEVLGEAAVIVEKYDADVATASLLRMINDVVYRKELGLQGQKYVAKKYSWKSAADRFLSLISK